VSVFIARCWSIAVALGHLIVDDLELLIRAAIDGLGLASMSDDRAAPHLARSSARERPVFQQQAVGRRHRSPRLRRSRDPRLHVTSLLGAKELRTELAGNSFLADGVPESRPDLGQ
jgi:hypothetical protein